MKETENKKETHWKDIVIGICLFVLIVGFWFASWQYVDHNIISDNKDNTNLESRGLFGDKFGAVNALFSGLAFAGIIFTIFLQKRELSLQRLELEETRSELKGQKIELTKANAYTALQQFDAKFFQLLNLHTEIRNNIHIVIKTNTYFNMENKTGVTFFESLAFLIAKRFYEDKYPAEIFGKGQTREKLVRVYHRAFHQYKTELGHYFRNLFHIVRIVDESNLLLDEQKDDYLKILRAQLSQYEIVLLSYNGMTRYGDKFYPLINKYELLKNIDFELLTPKDYVIKVISPTILINEYKYLKPIYEEQRKIFEEFNEIK